jgi:MFS family permease
MEVWIPILAKNELDAGPGGYGLLMAGMGLGALIGALALAFLVKGPDPKRMVLTGIGLGAGEIVLALYAWNQGSLIAAFLMIMVLGFAMTSTMAMANTVVQADTPAELRGRVMSVYMTVLAGTAPFGAILAGAVADLFGAPMSILLGGIITLGAVAFLGFHGAGLARQHTDLRSGYA